MRLRAAIYDAALLHLTERWYRAVLARLPPGARVLDVGIGTAGALARNAALVKQQGLRITGLDVDPDYVRAAIERVRQASLLDHVDVRHEPLAAHQGGPYDAVYFSGSFMLMPDPELALRQVEDLLTPAGQVFFTQTLQKRRSPLLEWLKPRLAGFTTVDFGAVSYADAFFERLDRGGWQVVEHTSLGAVPSSAHRLVSATPPERAAPGP